MAVDAFLELDGIPGDSLDDTYRGWIELHSYSWGAARPTASGAGGGATGRAQFQDLHFVVNFSKASPELFNRCATGEHIKSGVLAVRKAGEKPLEFYKLRMTDVLVSSFQDGSSGGFEPVEQVSLNFANIDLVYTPQSPTGA